MPAFPNLNRDALVRLRKLAEALHRHDGPAVPVDQLAELARTVQIDAGVTVDFEASESLGQPLIVVRMPQADAEPAVTAPAIQALSPREREVCALIHAGLANKEIARRLHLSIATIKDHVHRILTKTGFPNRAAIAAAYYGRPPLSAARPTGDS